MNPQVYVGTYGKYNDGNLSGAWIDLEDFASKADFLEHCAELHCDEPDPEFMFQDWTDIPAELVSECHIDEMVWELLEFDEYERGIIVDYCDNMVCQWDCDTMAEAMEAYCGEFESKEEFARYLVDNSLSSTDNELLVRYFDYSAYSKELFRHGEHVFVNGRVFRGGL